jgi:hypothetical protein
VKYDQVLVRRLTTILKSFIADDRTQARTMEQLLALFDMPCPDRTPEQIVRYLCRELRPLRKNPKQIRLSANGICSIIESEREASPYNMEHAWRQMPYHNSRVEGGGEFHQLS